MREAHKILVIDNEKKWLSFVRDALKDYVVDNAETSFTGMMKLDANGYELVIMDSIRLKDVPKIVKEGKKVMVVTVNPTTDEAIEAYRAGAMDYQIKANEKDQLKKAVEEAIIKPLIKKL